MAPVGSRRPRYRWAVTGYDRVYRFVHRLDTPASEVGPAIRIEVRRSYRTLRFADGAVVRPGDRIGVIHLNNERVAALASDGLSPVTLGLEFRRQFVASLRALADLASNDGPIGQVSAFTATSICHRGLRHLGFVEDERALHWPGLVAAYQRALLASLKPGGIIRTRHPTSYRARRLWISNRALLDRYGDARIVGSVGHDHLSVTSCQ